MKINKRLQQRCSFRIWEN